MTVDETIAGVEGDVRLRSAPGLELEPPELLLDLLERFGVPGISAAVVSAGSLAWARGWGRREAGLAEPVTSDTLFQAGSISKPVAALVALRLVELGQLDLDADVNDLLTSWQIPENDGWQPRVTVRQLLSHTAGLTVHGFPGYARDRQPPSLVEILDGSQVANTLPVRVRSLPSLQFSYSGGGYCVLQQLLVDHTGTAFPELARSLVLDPLGMRASGYEQPLPPEREHLAATGHRPAARPVAGRWHVYTEMAAAGLWTTPAELARFVLGIQAAAAGAPGALISSALAGELLTPVAPNVPMGLGLFVEGQGPARRFEHGGDDQGFVAGLVGYVHGGMGAVVMSSSDSGYRLVQALIEAIARAYDWPSYPGGAPQAEPARDLDQWLGGYALPDGRLVRVARAGDGYTLALPAQDALSLVADAPGAWSLGGLDATVAFHPADEGAPERLVIRQRAEYTEEAVAFRQADAG